jgi:predicted GIY-YIG superfamily endonuclease
MPYSIYTLSHPGTGEIFYVGCTSNIPNRMRAHSYSNAKCLAKYGKLTQAKDHYILSQRIEPVFHVIEEVFGDLETACAREGFWIAFLYSMDFQL